MAHRCLEPVARQGKELRYSGRSLPSMRDRATYALLSPILELLILSVNSQGTQRGFLEVAGSS
jgi:hypothetical protein